MDAYASDATFTEDIPGEAGQWIEFRGLGRADTQAARAVVQREGRRNAQDFGPEIYNLLINRPTTPQRIDPLGQHDIDTLLDRGIVRWSLPIHLPERSNDPAQTAERRAALGRLREKTAEWAARVLLNEAGIENALGLDAEAIEAEARPVEPGAVNPTTSASSLALID